MDSRKRYYNTIFDLEGMPPFSQFWAVGISQWQLAYRGNQRKKCACPAIADEKRTRTRSTLNIVKAVSQEIASMIMGERLNISITGRTEQATTILQSYLDEVLGRAGFYDEIGKLTEQAIACGGGAISVWADGERNEDGEIIADPKIMLRFFQANDFVPTAWDNSRVRSAVLVSHEAWKGKYYTRLEIHESKREAYVIRNRLFVSEANAILGMECPLTEIYQGLSPETVIETDGDGFFSYFANITQNNIDFNSPLGISLFASCADTIDALDTAFDSFGREFVLGKKRILVPSACIRTVRDRQGQEHRYFDADDEAYEVFYCDNPEALKIQDNTVILRVDEHVRAINALLDILAFQLGVSQGSFSFDKARGLKTATEVASENAKTYRFVKRMQEAIAAAVKKTIKGILTLSMLYEVEHDGKPIASLLAQGFEVSVAFDDGIIQDDAERRKDGIAMVNAGLISKRTFLVDYMHYTPEQADAELERVRAETPQTPDLMSMLGA